MSKSKKITVLYVDDEIHNLNSFRATFRKDFNILTAQSALEGLEIMAASVVPVHVVITDQKMPGMMGVDFLINVLEKYPRSIRILLVGFAEIGAIVDALNKGQARYRMEKPWDEDQVRAVINASYEIFCSEKAGDMKEAGMGTSEVHLSLLSGKICCLNEDLVAIRLS